MFNSFAGWSFILNILILLATVAGFIKVLKNDLWHLDKNVNEIKGDVKNIITKLEEHGERISKIEGNCNATHKK